MFKLIFRLTMLTLFVSGWIMAALALHVVRTPEKLAILPKDHLGLSDTYVDARHWTLVDLGNHPGLLKRVVEANRTPLFTYLINPSFGDAPSQLTGLLKGGQSVKSANIVNTKLGLPISVTDEGVNLPVVF